MNQIYRSTNIAVKFLRLFINFFFFFFAQKWPLSIFELQVRNLNGILTLLNVSIHTFLKLALKTDLINKENIVHPGTNNYKKTKCSLGKSFLIVISMM